MGLGGTGWVRQEKWIIWRPVEFLISAPWATPVLSVAKCCSSRSELSPSYPRGQQSETCKSVDQCFLVSHDVPGHQTPVINIKTWAFLSKDSKTSHSELERSNLKAFYKYPQGILIIQMLGKLCEETLCRIPDLGTLLPKWNVCGWGEGCLYSLPFS